MNSDHIELKIGSCSSEQFTLVKNYIKAYELDDRELIADQFLVATLNDQLVGFGRIREYPLCAEMCSLGVVEEYRNKGVAKALAKALIKKTNKPLYLVCIIPQFFTEFGFEICTSYPPELANKLHYCTSELVVEEPYVVMKKQ